MKRIILFALLLCLGLIGCGVGSPETETAAAPETLPQPVTPAVQALGEHGRWLPPFARRDLWEDGATYENVTEEAVNAWAAELEAAGFRTWEGSLDRLLYTDRLILRLCRSEYETGVYTLYWFEADPAAPTPDREAVQARMDVAELICLVDRTPAGMYEATGLRRLLCVVPGDAPDVPTQEQYPEGRWCEPREYLLGEAACVPARGYYGVFAGDPLWADLDGDGEAEYAYWTYGPTSGLFTVALWAYGTENGVPVVVGQTILNLSSGEVGLRKEGETLYFRCCPQEYDLQTQSFVPRDELRIPLRVEDGWILPAEGELPEEIQEWGGGPGWDCRGQSFTALRERVLDRLLYDSHRCVVWTDAYVASSPENVTTYAAFTSNGVSVTGYLSFRTTENGRQSVWRDGAALIKAPDDLTALAALSPEALTERFGPCHFDNGLGLGLPGWFTEDGKLLRAAAAEDRILCVALVDLTTGALLDEAGFLAGARLFDYAKDGTPRQVPDTDPAEPETVTVIQTNPTIVINEARLRDFVTAVEAGKPDALTVRLFYGKSGSNSGFTLKLRYDGVTFRLNDGERESSYKYFLVDEQNDPPAQARFRRAVHYLLSDDPDMTYDRYMSHMVSSALQPDFPSTTGFLTVYLD